MENFNQLLNCIQAEPKNEAKRHIGAVIFYDKNKTLDFSKADEIEYASYQLEKGELNGTLHWQCYIKFRKGKTVRFKKVMNKIAKPKTWGVKFIQTKKGETLQEAIAKTRNYTRKVATRVKGPFEYKKGVAEKYLSISHGLDKVETDEEYLKRLLKQKMEQIKLRQEFLEKRDKH